LDYWIPGTDNFSSALQKALNTKKRVWIPYNSAGYTHTAQVDLGTGMGMEFEGPNQIVTCSDSFARIGYLSQYTTNNFIYGNGTFFNFPPGSNATPHGVVTYYGTGATNGSRILQWFQEIRDIYMA